MAKEVGGPELCYGPSRCEILLNEKTVGKIFRRNRKFRRQINESCNSDAEDLLDFLAREPWFNPLAKANVFAKFTSAE